MIYKNGKKAELPSHIKAAVDKAFPEWAKTKTMEIRYMPHKIGKIKNKSGIPGETKPPTIGVIPVINVIEDGTVQQYRYVVNETLDKHGNSRFSPNQIDINDRYMLGAANEELFYFLAGMHPQINNSLALQKSPVCDLYFFRPQAEAENKLTKEKLVNVLRGKLSGEDYSDEAVLNLARAMHIAGIDRMSAPEIRMYLIQRCNHETSNEKFMNELQELMDSDAILKIHNNINAFIDKGLVEYRTHQRRWVYKDSNTEIAVVPPAMVSEPNKFLGDYLSKNQHKYKELLSYLGETESDKPFRSKNFSTSPDDQKLVLEHLKLLESVDDIENVFIGDNRKAYQDLQRSFLEKFEEENQKKTNNVAQE